jgi:hypothetical protein
LGIFSTAFSTYLHFHRSAAVVAEFTVAGRFIAYRAHGSLTLDLPFPDSSIQPGFIYISAHCIRPGFSYIDFLPGGAFRTQAFILIEAVITYIFITGMTAMKMALRFILGTLEGNFMFFLPFRTHTVKTIGQDIASTFYRVADIADSAADKLPEHGDTLCQASQTLALFISSGLYKGAFIAVIAYIAI